MPSRDFIDVYFPYCLEKQDNGSYVILNRNYKPVGFRTPDHVDYRKLPILVKIKGLTRAKAAKLSWKTDSDLAKIYLYDDLTTHPVRNKANMSLYLAKLEMLATLKLT
jgi:hypothetical protein